MTVNFPPSLKFKVSFGRIVLGVLVLIVAALILRIWDANRNVATFAFTITDDGISYDANRLTIFRNVPSNRKIIESVSRKNTVLLTGRAKNPPLIFKDIAGKRTWIHGFGFVSLYSTHVTLAPRQNRAEAIYFNPHSDSLTLREALKISERIRNWFLTEGFTHSPDRGYLRWGEPSLVLGDVEYLDEHGAVHPDIRHLIVESSQIENMFEDGFWALEAERGDIHMGVKVGFTAPHREAPETLLEDYETHIRVEIADISAH